MNATIARDSESSDGESAAPGDNQFDFDFIVIGSGFGGSVSALRLVEKGYKVAVMEMGRRWTPDNLPRTSWSIRRWFWRPNLGLRGFFNHAVFPARHHLSWLRGRRRIHHLCLHFASSSRESVGKRFLDWTRRLESGNAAALRNRLAHAGRNGKQNPRTRRPSPEKSGGSRGHWAYFLLHERGHLPACGGRAGQSDFRRSFLRRRRSGTNYVHRAAVAA